MVEYPISIREYHHQESGKCCSTKSMTEWFKGSEDIEKWSCWRCMMVLGREISKLWRRIIIISGGVCPVPKAFNASWINSPRNWNSIKSSTARTQLWSYVQRSTGALYSQYNRDKSRSQLPKIFIVPIVGSKPNICELCTISTATLVSFNSGSIFSPELLLW